MTITESETLPLEKLRGLASAEPPCITIVLSKCEARDARIAVKDALSQVRKELETRISGRDIGELLSPLEAAAAEVIDSSKAPATFIFLRSPGVCESFRTRYLLGQPLVATGECFQLFPLLALAGKRLDFYILSLKLNGTRIFKCNDENFDQARFPKNAGTETADFIPGESQGTLHAEAVNDHDHAEDYLGRFYREVDRDVNALLKDGHPPLVVVGVEREVAQFLRLTSYPACVKPGIHGLPERLSDSEVYRQALQLVRSVTTGAAHHELEHFDKKVGSGHASSDLAAIAEAASNGRVAYLFIREPADASSAGGGGAAMPDTATIDTGMLDTAILQTLRHGGDVRVLPEASLPGGVSLCAVFRYAAG